MVPESMIRSMIKAYHDDMAHCGNEKTTVLAQAIGSPQ